jgi:hypothetical protein
MAIEKVIDIKVQGNVDEAVGSLRSQLRQAQADVAVLSDKFGVTSVEAAQAARKAAELKDRIGDAKALTDAFNPDAKFRSLTASLSGVAGGFAAYQGALNLAGVENKNLEESLLKVQSAMALSQGLQALGESRDSFKQLKAVAVDALNGIKAGIGATGIGLLVVTLGLIVANWDAIVKSVKEAFPAFENIGEIFNKLKQYAFGAGEVIKNYILMPFKALGQLISGDFTGAIEEIKNGFDVLGNFEKGASKERQSQRDAAAAEQLAKLVKDNENRIEVLKASGKDTYNLELQNLQNKQKLYKEDKEKLAELLQAERVLRASHQKQLSDKAKADRIQKEKDDKEAAENAAKLLEEKKKKDEEEYEFMLKLQRGETESKAQEKQNQIDVLNAAIESDAEAEEKRKEKEAEDHEESVKKYRGRVEAIGSIAQSGENLLAAIQANGLAKGKAGQAVMKGFALVQIAADSAIAFSKMMAGTEAVATGASLSVPPPASGATYLATKIAFYASGSATILANLARARALLSGGGGGGGGAVTSPSAGGGGGATAPQFNVVGSTGVNQLAGVMGAQQQTPVQAYVVANNVTTAQSLDRNIIQSATLGG